MRILHILMLVSITSVLAPSQNETAKGPPLTIVIAVETSVVKAGSGVSVNGRLTNTSSKPLDASGCYTDAHK
jgi:hypothetical protein